MNAGLEEAKNAKLKRIEHPTATGIRKSRKDDLVSLVSQGIADEKRRIEGVGGRTIGRNLRRTASADKKEVGDLLIMNGKHKSKHGIIPALQTLLCYDQP